MKLITSDTVDALHGILSGIKGMVDSGDLTGMQSERLKDIALYLTSIVLGTPEWRHK